MGNNEPVKLFDSKLIDVDKKFIVYDHCPYCNSMMYTDFKEVDGHELTCPRCRQKYIGYLSNEDVVTNYVFRLYYRNKNKGS